MALRTTEMTVYSTKNFLVIRPVAVYYTAKSISFTTPFRKTVSVN